MNGKGLDNNVAEDTPWGCHEVTPMLALAINSTPPANIRRPLPLAIWPGEGVQNEVKKKPAQNVHHLGIVAAIEKYTPAKGIVYYDLRYCDPSTGKDVRRRIRGLELEEIKAVAKNLNEQAQRGKGHLASQPKAPALDEVFGESIRLSRASKRVKRMYRDAAKLFVMWLGENYPAVRTWDRLRPAMVMSYVRELETDGKAWDTIRNRLVPVKAAWKHAAENWPEMVRPLPALKLEAPPRREIQCLDAGEMEALLGWFKGRRPALYPMVCLQARAGLRMLEAAALRVQDIDLNAGTVEITDTGSHKPKTRDSYRVIPVCGEIRAALRAAMAGQKVRLATGELFTTGDGTAWALNSLSHRMHEAFQAAARELYPVDPKTGEMGEDQAQAKERMETIPPRKLRAAFTTLVDRLGANDRILNVYLGHTPKDVKGRHYRRVDLSDLRLVSSLLDGVQAAPSEGAGWITSGELNHAVELEI